MIALVVMKVMKHGCIGVDVTVRYLMALEVEDAGARGRGDGGSPR